MSLFWFAYFAVVGAILGVTLGKYVGSILGNNVGGTLGVTVGIFGGVNVWILVGIEIGEIDDLIVGIIVGIALGKNVGHLPIHVSDWVGGNYGTIDDEILVFVAIGLRDGKLDGIFLEYLWDVKLVCLLVQVLDKLLEMMLDQLMVYL